MTGISFDASRADGYYGLWVTLDAALVVGGCCHTRPGSQFGRHPDPRVWLALSNPEFGIVRRLKPDDSLSGLDGKMRGSKAIEQ
jgi:hypothetical protein